MAHYIHHESAWGDCMEAAADNDEEDLETTDYIEKVDCPECMQILNRATDEGANK